MTIHEDKAILRVRLRGERPRWAESAGARFSTAVVDHVLAAMAALGVDRFGAVAAYWSVGSEADTHALLHALHSRGFRVALPVVVAAGLPLVFRLWRPEDGLLPGPLRTRQPAPSAAEVEPDLVIVPLLAFDRRGTRLGQGGGYYDRTLKELRARRPIVAVGLGYAAQEVDRLPADPHDERLDWVVTENGAMKVGEAAA